jgi:hypothetical protein
MYITSTPDLAARRAREIARAAELRKAPRKLVAECWQFWVDGRWVSNERWREELALAEGRPTNRGGERGLGDPLARADEQYHRSRSPQTGEE